MMNGEIVHAERIEMRSRERNDEMNQMKANEQSVRDLKLETETEKDEILCDPNRMKEREGEA